MTDTSLEIRLVTPTNLVFSINWAKGEVSITCDQQHHTFTRGVGDHSSIQVHIDRTKNSGLTVHDPNSLSLRETEEKLICARDIEIETEEVSAQKIATDTDYPHPYFLEGRKIQFISDKYPKLAKVQGRAEKMGKLLPSLINNRENLEANFRITLGAEKGLVSTPDSWLRVVPSYLEGLDGKLQVSLGRDFQYLIDTDKVHYPEKIVAALSAQELSDTASLLRKRIGTRFFNLRRNRQLYENAFKAVNLFKCGELGCGIDYYHHTGWHCTECRGNLTIEHVAEHYNKTPPTWDILPHHVNCNGYKCRHHVKAGRGIHCDHCYASDSESTW